VAKRRFSYDKIKDECSEFDLKFFLWAEILDSSFDKKSFGGRRHFE
jgi:hypothetical protein